MHIITCDDNIYTSQVKNQTLGFKGKHKAKF